MPSPVPMAAQPCERAAPRAPSAGRGNPVTPGHDRSMAAQGLRSDSPYHLAQGRQASGGRSARDPLRQIDGHRRCEADHQLHLVQPGLASLAKVPPLLRCVPQSLVRAWSKGCGRPSASACCLMMWPNVAPPSPDTSRATHSNAAIAWWMAPDRSGSGRRDRSRSASCTSRAAVCRSWAARVVDASRVTASNDTRALRDRQDVEGTLSSLPPRLPDEVPQVGAARALTIGRALTTWPSTHPKAPLRDASNSTLSFCGLLPLTAWGRRWGLSMRADSSPATTMVSPASVPEV